MAAYGWRSGRSVEDWLFEEGYRFDFYQAVRLLEWRSREAVSVGEGENPAREAVRFKSRVDLGFPGTDLDGVSRPSGPGGPAEMTVNFMGLAGAFGPLPAPFTELILERVWHRDTALRDFLDIFNHRLISLMYRVRKTHRIGLDSGPPEHGLFSRRLYCLMGLGTPGLQGRMRVSDRALLFYSGVLASQPRTLAGLEVVLSDYFQVPAKGRSFCGGWDPIEASQWTAIGRSGQNQRLGVEAVLGTRVWNQNGRFEVVLGPLGLKAFLNFLPGENGFRSVCELIRFYVGPTLDFRLRLVLSAGEVPESRLGGSSGARLGWTSWLKTRQTQGDPEVALSSET